MSFYQVNLAAFVAVAAYLTLRQYKTQKPTGALLAEDRQDEVANSSVRRFQLEFSSVFSLAMAADWLQGPRIYAMYKYEKHIEESLVAMLYGTGFISGAVSATFAGQLADRYGRRLACLLYCVCYAVTCCSMMSNSLPILLMGRVFGGIATTLLFSVFEAWMITEYYSRNLHKSSLTLSHVFANMTTLSGVIAILSGILGDSLVSYFGTRLCPFLASLVCCIGTASMIFSVWFENYGQKDHSEPEAGEAGKRMWDTLKDSRVMALGAVSCCFEGAMYLFVFFWSSTLVSARAKTGPGSDPPFGIIFSCFMCAMMAGSAVFSLFNKPQSNVVVANLLRLVVLILSASLAGATFLDNEYLLFWTFCLIEGAVGAYYPSIAYMKSQRIEDDIRGSVYSALRFPMNVFVVVAHSLDEEGDQHRKRVFLTCAALLLLSFFAIRSNV